MKHQSPIFAIDIGTTKMCLAVLDYPSKQQPRLRTFAVSSSGMKQGMLFDFSQASSSLANLIDQAEKELNIDIDNVCVGVAGSHLGGKNIQVEKTLDGIITIELLQKWHKETEENSKVEHMELIHCIPTGYKIDSRSSVDNPIGLSGYQIKISYFLVYADRSYLKDIIRLCNQNGLRVDSIYAEAVASASVILDEQAKENGATIVDIGGGSSDCLVFQKGHPVDIFTVNIAGMLMSADLAIGLNLDFDEAERVKKLFDLNPGSQRTLIKAKSREVSFDVSGASIQKILKPRVKELSYFLAKHLIKYKGRLKGGIILTGGCSNIEGLDKYMYEILKIPVKQVNPTLCLNTNHSMNSIYATSLGLVNLQLNKRRTQKNHFKSKYISSFVNWIKELM